ncbi:hypothetical protein BUQ74_16805 [Leptospira weilii serovar Heyan]|nr:hypothetical protein BUQ74_16805 [Leptospira weilii serovar Heyan]
MAPKIKGRFLQEAALDLIVVLVREYSRKFIWRFHSDNRPYKNIKRKEKTYRIQTKNGDFIKENSPDKNKKREGQIRFAYLNF